MKQICEEETRMAMIKAIQPDFINDDEKSIFGAFFKPVLDKDFDDYCYKQNKA